MIRRPAARLSPKAWSVLRALNDVGALRVTRGTWHEGYVELIDEGWAELFNVKSETTDIRLVRHTTRTNHPASDSHAPGVAAPSIPVDGAAVSSRGVA